MLILALLPLSALALLQTNDTMREARAGQLSSALSQTLAAAEREINTIEAAQAATETLAAAITPYVNDPDACRRMVEAVWAATPEASLVAFTPLSGRMTCASGGNTYDFSGNPLFAKMIARPEPSIVVNPRGPVSGTSVIGIGHPVFDELGKHIGIVSLSLPHRTIDAVTDKGSFGTIGAPETLISFDGSGIPLTSSVGLDDLDRYLPPERPLDILTTGGPQTFIATSGSGERRLFAVVPIAENINVMGVWTTDDYGLLIDPEILPYLYPLLMCIAGLTVATLAAQYLVTRHIGNLSRSILAFAGGNRTTTELALKGAPDEIISLGEAYQTMTRTILQDEAEMEDLLRQNQELLREVHHRTGNSLQLIASILRMHLRDDPDTGVRRILENLHERVMSLSTVHLGLYRMAGRPAIEMGQLLAEVIARMRPVFEASGAKTGIRSEIASLVLPAQQAVPVALYLAEVLSAFHTFRTDAPKAEIRIRLVTKPDNTVKLIIEGPALGAASIESGGDSGPTAIAARLIRGFVQQLDGQLEVVTDADEGSVQLTFLARQVA